MLKQKFLIDFGAKFGIYLITALTGIIVARLAGPKVVGTIAYATSYVSVFSFITSLFGSAYIKIVSEGENEADSIATFRQLYVISLVIYFIVVTGFYLIQKLIINYKFESTDVEIVIIITLFANILGSFYQFVQTIFVARTEQAKANVPNFLKALLYNLLRIIVVLMGMGAIALAGVNLISALIILPLVISMSSEFKSGKYNSRLAKKIYSISLPLFIVVVVQSLMMYTDKLILGYYANTAEIGYYTAAYSIGGMLILVGNTAGTVFFPLFSSYFSKNQLEQVKQKIFQFENFIFNFLLPFVITLSIFASPIIITLLGKRYESSAPIFSLLVISSFFIIWSMPYGNVLSGLGLFWLSTILYIIQFLIFIITLFISIHPQLLNMGSMALAITQVTISFSLFLGFYYIAWYKIKVQFIKRQLRYISLAIFLYFGTYFGILVHLKVVSVYVQSFLIVPIFLLIYYSLEYLLGLLKKSDLIILLELMNPYSSLKYVKKEFKNNSYNDPTTGL